MEFRELVLFEHRFWLQILGDHSRFILNTLSPKEIKEVQVAEEFKKIFDNLLSKARTPLVDTEIIVLTKEANIQAKAIRNFKLALIKKHLEEEIVIGLSPTFLNHMVNEVEEYIRVNSSLLSNKIPIEHPLHYHLIWLLDGVGHAETIACSLDTVEDRLIKISKKYSKIFKDFYEKAVEMTGYTRTGLSRFSALDRFNSQVDSNMNSFKTFLNELEKMELSNKTLGTLTPLMPDHMAREECYYLIKLALSSESKRPDCDPTKPRVIQ